MARTEVVLCCADPGCKTRKNIIEFFKLWGLDSAIQTEGQRSWIDFAVPDFWGKRRRKRFEDAVRQLKRHH
jgi:hypothetical protein